MFAKSIRSGFARFLVAGALSFSSICFCLKAADDTANPASALYQMPAESVQTRWFTAENP